MGFDPPNNFYVAPPMVFKTLVDKLGVLYPSVPQPAIACFIKTINTHALHQQENGQQGAFCKQKNEESLSMNDSLCFTQNN